MVSPAMLWAWSRRQSPAKRSDRAGVTAACGGTTAVVRGGLSSRHREARMAACACAWCSGRPAPLQTGHEGARAGALLLCMARQSRCLSPSGVLAYPAGLGAVGAERCKGAGAQQSPGEGHRVIMGKVSSLKPSPCGQDVGQEVSRRTPQYHIPNSYIRQPRSA